MHFLGCCAEIFTLILIKNKIQGLNIAYGNRHPDQKHDDHARIIAAALRRKSVAHHLIRTDRFPITDTQSLRLTNERTAMVLHGGKEHKEGGIDSLAFDTIWLRRPTLPDPYRYGGPDGSDEAFMFATLRQYWMALFQSIDRRACGPPRWVNHPDTAAKANLKLLQLEIAKDIGFETPDTLISNDPDDIAHFFRHHGGDIICKTFIPYSWGASPAESRLSCTARIRSMAGLEDAMLRHQPAIYQPNIAKDHEIRAAVFAHRVFASHIDSQAASRSRIDQQLVLAKPANCRRCELPMAVQEKAFDLLNRLGLVFGTVDFIVTPEGQYIFLEVNEAGQFLYQEHCDPRLPLLDAFSHFLVEGDLEHWTPDSDLALKVIQQSEELRAVHAQDDVTDTPDKAAQAYA